jgi:hypothetical protein
MRYRGFYLPNGVGLLKQINMELAIYLITRFICLTSTVVIFYGFPTEGIVSFSHSFANRCTKGLNYIRNLKMKGTVKLSRPLKLVPLKKIENSDRIAKPVFMKNQRVPWRNLKATTKVFLRNPIKKY